MASAIQQSLVVRCTCGKSVKQSGLEQHQKESPRHQAERLTELVAAQVSGQAPSQAPGQAPEPASRRTSRRASASDGKVTCPCGMTVKRSGLEQHIRDSARHRAISTTLAVHTTAPTRGVATDSSSAPSNPAEVVCDCGKTIKRKGLRQHMRDSALHGDPAKGQKSERSTKPKSRRKSHPQISLYPHGEPLVSSDLYGIGSTLARQIDEGEILYYSFARTSTGSAGRASAREYMGGSGRSSRSGFYNGNGLWCDDVGDNHGLCDKDCGWCGHCADGML